MACSWDREANVAAAEALVREAAGQGAQVVLIQELFETPYFCCDQKESHFALAQPAEGNPLLARMAALAAELEVVQPVSFFERANKAHYNSLAMLHADGRNLRVYRKPHIPARPGHEHKNRYHPRDTRSRVGPTRHRLLGAATSR